MQQRVSNVTDYILRAMLNHRVVEPMGSHGTVWVGVDFSDSIGVVSESERQAVRDLYDALEGWVWARLESGEPIPPVDGIDLNSDVARRTATHHDFAPRARDPEQQWFWTDEWQEREREADRDIEAGRVTTDNDGDDFLASLT